MRTGHRTATSHTHGQMVCHIAMGPSVVHLVPWCNGTLDSESSNRGSHPRGTSFTVEPHVAVYSLTPGALSSKFFVCRSRRCVYLPSSHAHTHRISEGPARVIWEPQKCLDDPAGIRAGPSVNKDLQAPMRRDSS